MFSRWWPGRFSLDGVRAVLALPWSDCRARDGCMSLRRGIPRFVETGGKEWHGHGAAIFKKEPICSTCHPPQPRGPARVLSLPWAAASGNGHFPMFRAMQREEGTQAGSVFQGPWFLVSWFKLYRNIHLKLFCGSSNLFLKKWQKPHPGKRRYALLLFSSGY